MPLKKTERQDSAASTKALTTENVEEEASMYFGCWGCHPKCLQILANAKFFTFILCVFSLIEGATVSGELNKYTCTCINYYYVAFICYLSSSKQFVSLS